MEQICGIYKITNKINNKSYIGKSNNIKRRWKDHTTIAFKENNKEYNKALYQAFRKYGINNFSFELIEKIEKENYKEESGIKEQYWIDYYDSYACGYNESLGGDGGSAQGHCRGEANGKAKLSEQDVIYIRTQYKEHKDMCKCYENFKDKISYRGFKQVWNGNNWKNIMPEIYTEENKKINKHNNLSVASKKRLRLLTMEEVDLIRKMRKDGKSYKEIRIFLNNKCSISLLKDIVANKAYRKE